MRPLLLGCPFDNGIHTMLRFRRGVTGAADGPAAVLAAFEQQFRTRHPHVTAVSLPLQQYNLPLNQDNWRHIATATTQHLYTEQAHALVADSVAAHYRENYLPIAIGGDHSLTFPLVRGLKAVYPQRSVGLIYLDSHLDMRSLESFRGVRGLVSNGNSFRRLVVDMTTRLDGRNMAIIGLQPARNSIFWQMSNFAKSQQVTMVHRDEIGYGVGEALEQAANRAIAAATDGTDGVYLSLDIGVADRSVAPGVSAPNSDGLSAEQLLALVRTITRRVPLLGVDLVEVSSRKVYWGELWGEKPLETDRTGQHKLEKTADLAARVLNEILCNL